MSQQVCAHVSCLVHIGAGAKGPRVKTISDKSKKKKKNEENDIYERFMIMCMIQRAIH